MVIGGEQGKGGHVGIGIGRERGKVGHVGFGRGVTSFFWDYKHVTVKSKIGRGVSDVTRVEKNEYLFFNEKLPGSKVTSGNVGPDRVSRRASHFYFWKKKESRNKTNKTKCHRRPAWASCRSGRTMSHKSGSTSNKPQFSQRV